MGLVESLPVQRVRPVLFLPLWLGTLRDVSGYGNHGSVVASPNWTHRGALDGLNFGAAGDYVSVPHDASLIVSGQLSIFAFGDFTKQAANNLILRKQGTGGRYHFYASTAAALAYYDGSVVSSLAVSVIGSSSVAMSTASGIKPEFFIDGATAGLGSVVNTVPEVTDGIVAHGGPGQYLGQSAGVLIYPSVLTPTEISDLHTWSQSRITPRKQWPGGGLDIPTLSGAANEPKFLDNISSSRVTLQNETSGSLSNLGLEIITGTWAVAEDDTGKYISCVVAGKLRRNLIGASGFTTDSFVETGGATLTKNANNFEIDATAGDIIRSIRLVA